MFLKIQSNWIKESTNILENWQIIFANVLSNSFPIKAFGEQNSSEGYVLSNHNEVCKKFYQMLCLMISKKFDKCVDENVI